jgi:GntR family transcriptional repressor for pyruvate dehydrogenase complex
MPFQSVMVNRSYDQVVQQLQDAIQTRKFLPGERLPTERELAERFSVGRGVVREALKSLAHLGLVESRQGSGTFVRSDPSPIVTRALTLSVAADERSTSQLFDVRGILEDFAARQAALLRTDAQAKSMMEAALASNVAALAGDTQGFATADDHFHQLMGEAAGNPYLTVMIRAIKDMHTDLIVRFAEIPGSIVVASGHHIQIAKGIEARDPDAAAAGIREHIRYTDSQVARVVRGSGRATDERGETTV